MISTTNPLKARAQALYQKTNWAEESGLAKTSRETAQLYQAAFDSLDLGNFLAPEGRELKAFEGRVTDTKRGMARFKLEGSERSFNSNSMFATVRERPAGHRDRPRLNLDDSMTPEQRLAELDRLYRGA